MMLPYDKIVSPKSDSIVLGGRTLGQVVSIMDRMRGIVEVVDIPSTSVRRRSIFKDVLHSRVKGGSIHSHTSLRCHDGLSFFGRHAEGREVWRMSIAHHPMHYGSRPNRYPTISSKLLEKFIHESQIAYVITPRIDATRDLDYLETIINKCDEALSTIGGWVRMDLSMRVECTCGRISWLKARETFGSTPSHTATPELLKRMRCMICGAANVDSARPYYANRDSAVSRYINELGAKSPSHATISLDEIYQNVGGDGQGPVYLSDGLYIDPDGNIYE